jgi:hypothetical protein
VGMPTALNYFFVQFISQTGAKNTSLTSPTDAVKAFFPLGDLLVNIFQKNYCL